MHTTANRQKINSKDFKNKKVTSTTKKLLTCWLRDGLLVSETWKEKHRKKSRKRVETWNIVLSVSFYFSTNTRRRKSHFLSLWERSADKKERRTLKKDFFVLFISWKLRRNITKRPEKKVCNFRVRRWISCIRMFIWEIVKTWSPWEIKIERSRTRNLHKKLANDFKILSDRWFYFISKVFKILRNGCFWLFSMSLKKYSRKNLWRFRSLQSFSACRRVSWFLSIRNLAKFVKTRFLVRGFESEPTIWSLPASLQMM